MPFIEAPTTFYLGRRYDPRAQKVLDEIVYYDSRDLTTHAVVLGMTGSGKTGLCIDLLEEAALDNIPSIIIDPKGDITNLLLTFPDLRPADFAPWVNLDDARRAGKEIDDYAAEVATRWRKGLADWHIVPDRVKWLKHAADFSIYTPGSDSGLPVSILDAMQAPREGWAGYEEAHRERISGMVTALLALVGRQVEPVKDREHVLIANIFEHAWRQGQGLTLEDVIIQVQQPPFQKLGVFDVDTFFPEKERFKLAMELNHIIAAPSFQSWLTGEPLDVRSLLFTAEGKPRVSVFYIAHLNDAERQFIITLLLENVLAWLRTLSGTTSLRALLYIDEVFGMFPPHPYNPPTKEPILRLLKQARAFGLGLILATQNPGDLDYKGLANAGTWFIGKLQTENDQKKVMTGLEALASVRADYTVRQVGDLIEQLAPRIFLMHNVHEENGPLLFHTRWAMSYLRGPLTRQQISTLMAAKRAKLRQRAIPLPGSGGYMPPTQGATAPVTSARPGITPPPASLPETEPLAAPPPSLPETEPLSITPPPTILPEQDLPPGVAARPETLPGSGGADLTQPIGRTQASRPAIPAGASGGAPVLPSSIAQYFLPGTIPARTALANWERQFGFLAQQTGVTTLVYRPFLLAQASVRYLDRRTGVNTVRQVAYHVPDVPRMGLIHWEQHVAAPVDPTTLAQTPAAQAIFAALPPALTDEKRLRELQNEVVEQIFHTASLVVLYSPTLKVFSDPDASRRDFRVMLQALVRERRDEEVDRVTAQYAARLDRLEERLQREVRELEADRADLADRKREQLFTAGEAALSLFRGRTTYTLSRYSRTQRYSRQAEVDLRESEQEIATLEDQIEQTTREMEAALRAVNDKWARVAAEAEEYRITPFKKNIYLELFGVGWMPFWQTVVNGQAVLLPANPIAVQNQL
ncbi:MAG: DUF87 domain-containing protein [Anaerolineae bacterium]|nr:DUF87 domain-containing protein [Anaerolineae bacterium]